jgi:hypothetical protein
MGINTMHEENIRKFFTQYEARFNQSLQDPPVLDIDGVAASFTDFFIEASPLGVSGGKNDEKFREMIPQGFAFYKSIGTKSMKVANLDIIALDDDHAMAKVHWDSRYIKRDGSKERIEFDVIYFLQLLRDEPKIFAYITGDEQRVLKEHGLIPT